MARKTKLEKILEAKYNELFRSKGNNIQFDMMDLGKMHDEWNESVMKGQSYEDAMDAVIQKYRKIDCVSLAAASS